MAVTRETLRLAAELRISLDRDVDSTTRALVQAWVRAWDTLYATWQDSVDDLVAASEDGRWPSPWKVRRAERVRRALDTTQGELERLATAAGVTITDQTGAMVDLATRMQPLLIASELPDAYAARRFERADQDVLRRIVERTTRQITATTRPLAADATEAMKRALIRGVVVGENPRTAARRMLRGLEHGFNGGLTRAMVIARTEMLDVHRAAAAAQQLANSDVLAGWQWLAALDRRTCPSCWSQHGSIHRVDEPGPLDHQQGRCTRVPVTRPWRDLGIGLTEPPSVMPDARDVFDGLSPATQARIMGGQRLELLQSGRISWADLSQRRTTRGWRDSYAVAPVRDLDRSARAAA